MTIPLLNAKITGMSAKIPSQNPNGTGYKLIYIKDLEENQTRILVGIQPYVDMVNVDNVITIKNAIIGLYNGQKVMKYFISLLFPTTNDYFLHL